MGYRRRQTRAKQAIVRYVKKNLNRAKVVKRQRKAGRAVKQLYNKVHNKVPFTYHFSEMSHHHHKKHSPQTPTQDLTTVLIPKGEYSYCSRMARLIMTEHLKGKRLPKQEYFENWRHVMSHLIISKCYDRYILACNRTKLEEGGLIEKRGHHHSSHQVGGEAGEELREEEKHEETEFKRGVEEALWGCMV